MMGSKGFQPNDRTAKFGMTATRNTNNVFGQTTGTIFSSEIKRKVTSWDRSPITGQNNNPAMTQRLPPDNTFGSKASQQIVSGFDV